MKILDSRNFGEAPNLDIIYVLEGYDISTPDLFINGPYRTCFLKKGCPIWIKCDENYTVLEIQNEETWKQETIGYIQNNLPYKEDPICRYIFQNEVNDKSFIVQLSGCIFDRKGEILANIKAFDSRLPNEISENKEDSIDIPTIKIEATISKGNANNIGELMENILQRNCLDNYRGRIMWYRNNDTDFTNELGFTNTKYGYSFRKI